MGNSFYSNGTGPENLDSFAGDMPKLIALCDTYSLEQLYSAYNAIHVHHYPWRNIVREAIQRRESEEAAKAADARHKEGLAETGKAYRLAVYAIWVALISLGIAAAAFVWTFF